MKDLPEPLREKLATGATTLCWCWRLQRRDGVVLGFTDHDRDLTFAGTLFEAAAGISASELKDSVGLSVDNLEVSGALSSDRLTEADLAAGRYDDARVELYRVDWTSPENRVLMRAGSLGEVQRSGGAFQAEVRGLAHYLQQPKGRLFQKTCDADLGDARCGKDVTGSDFTGSGSIVSVLSERSFMADGLAAFANDLFTRGRLTFTSGAAAGQSIEVKADAFVGGVRRIEIWQPVMGSLEEGQTFTVTAGCDKQLSTCRSRFANAVNFRGFPHMPGNDFIVSPRRR